MSTFVTVLAQAAGGPFGNPLFFLAACCAIFYFLVFRPQQREKQERRQMLGSLEKHDKIVTHGGIHGTVHSVKEDRVVLTVDEAKNSKITFSKNAIASITEKKKSKQDKRKEEQAASK